MFLFYGGIPFLVDSMCRMKCAFSVAEYWTLRYQALGKRATFSGETSVTARLAVCGLFSRQ